MQRIKQLIDALIRMAEGEAPLVDIKFEVPHVPLRDDELVMFRNIIDLNKDQRKQIVQAIVHELDNSLDDYFDMVNNGVRFNVK